MHRRVVGVAGFVKLVGDDGLEQAGQQRGQEPDVALRGLVGEVGPAEACVLHFVSQDLVRDTPNPRVAREVAHLAERGDADGLADARSRHHLRKNELPLPS